MAGHESARRGRPLSAAMCVPQREGAIEQRGVTKTSARSRIRLRSWMRGCSRVRGPGVRWLIVAGTRLEKHPRTKGESLAGFARRSNHCCGPDLRVGSEVVDDDGWLTSLNATVSSLVRAPAIELDAGRLVINDRRNQHRRPRHVNGRTNSRHRSARPRRTLDQPRRPRPSLGRPTRTEDGIARPVGDRRARQHAHRRGALACPPRPDPTSPTTNVPSSTARCPEPSARHTPHADRPG